MSQTDTVKGAEAAIDGAQATNEVSSPTEAHERGAFPGVVHCDQVVQVLLPATSTLSVAELKEVPEAPHDSTVGEAGPEARVQVSCTRRLLSWPLLGSPKMPLPARNCEHVCVPTTHHADTMAVLSTPWPSENGGKP